MASESSSPPAAEPIKPFEFAKVAPSVLQRVAGPVYTLWMLFMAWFGVIYLMLPCLPLVFVSPALFRKVMDAMGFYWYHVTVIFQRYVLGVRVVISGDPLPASDRAALFISNHRTRLDWLFLWNYFALNGRLLHEKIVLKAELKGFGPFGWAMQFLRFLFLKRDLAADARTMAEFFSAYAHLRYPLHLLLFPPPPRGPPPHPPPPATQPQLRRQGRQARPPPLPAAPHRRPQRRPPDPPRPQPRRRLRPHHRLPRRSEERRVG